MVGGGVCIVLPSVIAWGDFHVTNLDYLVLNLMF